MDKLTNGLRCPRCGKGFRVEIQGMRANVSVPCPSCGYQCGISEVQAIRAHRLLDWFEYRGRVEAA